MEKMIYDIPRQNTWHHNTWSPSPCATSKHPRFGQLLRTLMVGLLMLTGSVGAWAADYVLAYVNGNTTYYLARNGTNAVERVTNFDPTTCIWSCASNTDGTTAGTLNDNTTYGYLFQTVSGTRYFLSASSTGLALANTASANNNSYTRWRTNGTYVYNRYSNNTAYYINLANGVARNTTANTTSNARPYQVTTSTVTSTSANPTITGADVITATGNTNYTASGAAYRIGYTNYNFNSANHYIDASGNSFTGTPAAATIGAYTWSLTDNAYASLDNSNPGRVVVSSLPESDVTLTLTVTATVTGGTPTAPAGTTLTASKDIILLAAIPSVPTITRSGNNVILETASLGATIYYTTDGTDPSASNGTAYTSPFSLEGLDLPVTVKAIAVRNGNSSNAAEQEYATLSCATPVISISSTGAVTITCASTGASIRYTTDGTTPTSTSGNVYGGTFTVPNLTTVNAIAYKDGYESSGVASGQYFTSGTSGGTVILYEYEDHNWTYYSDKPDADYPDNLHSPEPRNVKITYRGGNVNNASAVAVSATEPENEFVYYKTIEKKAWGQDEGRWLTGNYAYKVIPNPFSKRPRTNGATGTNGFYGFAGWKIISGGQYINGHNNNDVLGLEEKINFVDLPAGNDGNGAVVFEATWTAANVVTVSGNVSGDAGLPNSGTYETNFIVVSGNDRTITGMTRNATVMGCYPDGSGATGGRLSTVTGSGNDLKIENINLGTGGSDFTANTGWLIVGRGCTGNVRRVIGNTGQIKMRIESGTYNFVHPMHNNGSNSHNNANYGLIIFGNDYDRATNDGLTSNDQYADNSTHRKLRVINYVSFNGTGADKASNDNRDEWMDITIKSGYYGYSADFNLYSTTADNNADGFGLGIGGNTDNAGSYTAPDINGTNRTYTNLNAGVNNTTYRWQRLMSFYCGRTRGGNYGGVNRVLVEGGELNSINGGGYRNTGANFDVCYHFRMKGGWVKGAIYGTASSSQTNATTKQVITGGEINGWVAGACNGTDVDNAAGENLGDTYIYLGGNAELRSHRKDGVYNNAWGLIGGVEGGNLFASGRGTPATNAQPNRNYCGSSYKTYAVVADNSQVEQNVCGGGYIGVAQNSHIYITGGVVGNVYGGSMTPTSTNDTWMTQTTDIRQYGGTVKEGIYGGHYQGTGNAGKIHQNVNVSVVNGQIGIDTDHPANVHGGGFGSGTSVGGNVDVTIGDATKTESLVIYGDVYGGSALGTVNDAATDYTHVTLNKGTINGSLYGGGLGNAGNAANVYGPVQVKVYGGSVRKTDSNGANGSGGVYGANNVNGAPQRSVTVDIYGTDDAPSENEYALYAVYGGGNQADYTYGNGYPKVTVHNCDNSIEYVYGGGNAAAVAATDVTIWGGNKIGTVFAGGNGTVHAANVTGNTSVIIYGGTIGKVFGGSNSQGTIGGTISVNVAKQGGDTDPDGSSTACTMHIDEVYGGGNMAASNAGSITIGCTGDEGEGIGDVYGGANAADITGNITLNITGGSIERVFGGNNASGAISGDIEVNINWTEPTTCGHNYLGYVYGAGREADYGGNPVVNIIKGTVTHDVYGGGLLADVTGNVAVNMVGGAVLGDLYGGGALANTNTGGTGKTTTVNLTGGTVNNVYGGGLGRLADAANNIEAVEALVGGNVTVTLNGSTETGATNDCVVKGSIFGCNNINGTPKGHVKVWVVKTVGWTGHEGTASGDKDDESATHTYHVAAVYGGGNMAAYVPTSNDEYAEVLIDGCNETSIQTVYGGGNAASTPATLVTVNGSYEIEEVFGGGNGLSDVTKNGVTYPNPGANVGYKDYSEYYQDEGVWKVKDKDDADTKEERQREGSPYVYGTGEAKVNIFGGTIHRVFGGSNTKGNVRYTAVTMLEDDEECVVFLIDEAYGGGKSAPMDAEAKLLMSCIPGLKAVYGGAQAADIMGNVVLNVTNGTFERVFGGNNISGTISGSITVNIEETGCKPLIIGELYGGGNQAAYSVYGYNDDKTPKESGTPLYNDPVVNVKSFTSIGDIFGGGYGETAMMVGNPTVNISVAEGKYKDTAYDGVTKEIDGHSVIIPNHAAGKIGAIQRVFGGGNAAKVQGNTNVNIGTLSEVYVTVPDTEINVGTTDVSSYFTRTGEGTTASPYVYAPTTGTAAAGTTYYQKLSVVGADIRGNVFGGGNAAEVSGDTNVVVGKAN